MRKKFILSITVGVILATILSFLNLNSTSADDNISTQKNNVPLLENGLSGNYLRQLTVKKFINEYNKNPEYINSFFEGDTADYLNNYFLGENDKLEDTLIQFLPNENNEGGGYLMSLPKDVNESDPDFPKDAISLGELKEILETYKTLNSNE
ncbi:hypothetical protein [Streptococcus marimammalium]|uniref:hypothetical protein n=1 Tax=Streptococcus marimammalium TaxID=269666 RepID=UPI00035FB764|nr:hypothetical protein [Streptococcus marimammalium]